MEAKELEVNHLVNEQNALLLKLKRFWRPILTSSSAKVLQDKTTRSAVDTEESSTAEKVQEKKSSVMHPQERSPTEEKVPDKDTRSVFHPQDSSMADTVKTSMPLKETKGCSANTVETQTEEAIAGENMCHCTTSPTESGYEDNDLPQDQEIFPKIKEKVNPFSRLSTPGRKYRHSSRPGKKNDDDLIASYLTKLQKAYVKSREVSSDPFVIPSINSVLGKSTPIIADNDGTTPTMEPRHTPRSSVDSKESCEINDARSDNLARYVICIPRRESCKQSGNTFFLKTRRKKKVVDANHLLRIKLQNLEDLSQSLLNKGHHF